MTAADVKKLTPSRLAELLGDEAATRLMDLFGGRRIPKRSPFHVEHSERHRLIAAYVKVHGYKAAAVAFGLSERQVRRHAHGY